MKNKLESVAAIAAFLLGLGVITVPLTAILSRYEGTVDLKLPGGGQVRVVGSPVAPDLPSADKTLPSGK